MPVLLLALNQKFSKLVMLVEKQINEYKVCYTYTSFKRISLYNFFKEGIIFSFVGVMV